MTSHSWSRRPSTRLASNINASRPLVYARHRPKPKKKSNQISNNRNHSFHPTTTQSHHLHDVFCPPKTTSTSLLTSSSSNLSNVNAIQGESIADEEDDQLGRSKPDEYDRQLNLQSHCKYYYYYQPLSGIDNYLYSKENRSDLADMQATYHDAEPNPMQEDQDPNESEINHSKPLSPEIGDPQYKMAFKSIRKDSSGKKEMDLCKEGMDSVSHTPSRNQKSYSSYQASLYSHRGNLNLSTSIDDDEEDKVKYPIKEMDSSTLKPILDQPLEGDAFPNKEAGHVKYSSNQGKRRLGKCTKTKYLNLMKGDQVEDYPIPNTQLADHQGPTSPNTNPWTLSKSGFSQNATTTIKTTPKFLPLFSGDEDMGRSEDSRDELDESVPVIPMEAVDQPMIRKGNLISQIIRSNALDLNSIQESRSSEQLASTRKRKTSSAKFQFSKIAPCLTGSTRNVNIRRVKTSTLQKTDQVSRRLSLTNANTSMSFSAQVDPPGSETISLFKTRSYTKHGKKKLGKTVQLDDDVNDLNYPGIKKRKTRNNRTVEPMIQVKKSSPTNVFSISEKDTQELTLLDEVKERSCGQDLESQKSLTIDPASLPNDKDYAASLLLGFAYSVRSSSIPDQEKTNDSSLELAASNGLPNEPIEPIEPISPKNSHNISISTPTSSEFQSDLFSQSLHPVKVKNGNRKTTSQKKGTSLTRSRMGLRTKQTDKNQNGSTNPTLNFQNSAVSSLYLPYHNILPSTNTNQFSINKNNATTTTSNNSNKNLSEFNNQILVPVSTNPNDTSLNLNSFSPSLPLGSQNMMVPLVMNRQSLYYQQWLEYQQCLQPQPLHLKYNSEKSNSADSACLHLHHHKQQPLHHHYFHWPFHPNLHLVTPNQNSNFIPAACHSANSEANPMALPQFFQQFVWNLSTNHINIAYMIYYHQMQKKYNINNPSAPPSIPNSMSQCHHIDPPILPSPSLSPSSSPTTKNTTTNNTTANTTSLTRLDKQRIRTSEKKQNLENSSPEITFENGFSVGNGSHFMKNDPSQEAFEKSNNFMSLLQTSQPSSLSPGIVPLQYLANDSLNYIKYQPMTMKSLDNNHIQPMPATIFFPNMAMLPQNNNGAGGVVGSMPFDLNAANFHDLIKNQKENLFLAQFQAYQQAMMEQKPILSNMLFSPNNTFDASNQHRINHTSTPTSTNPRISQNGSKQHYNGLILQPLEAQQPKATSKNPFDSIGNQIADPGDLNQYYFPPASSNINHQLFFYAQQPTKNEQAMTSQQNTTYKVESNTMRTISKTKGGDCSPPSLTEMAVTNNGKKSITSNKVIN